MGYLNYIKILRAFGGSLLIKITHPTVHLALYILLLVMTPFLLLQNYLQTAIGRLSESTIALGDYELPVVVGLVLVFSALLLTSLRKKLHIFHFLGLGIVLVQLWIGQSVADYYFRHRFYDLQHNWHYFAYGIFSYLVYRVAERMKLTRNRTILFTIVGALVISTFDEAIQVFISSRIFDIGDIAKDSWGSLTGMLFIFVGLESGALAKEAHCIRHTHLKAHLNSSVGLLFWVWVFIFILLNVSALLTDREYLGAAVLITLAVFISAFLLAHISQWRPARWVLGILFTAVILILSASMLTHRDEPVLCKKYGLIMYKGIPIPFFDVMIHPNGWPRLVDKKHLFNARDQNTLHSLGGDILLIGSGHEGQGGRGFRRSEEMHFVFNKYTGQGMQVIVLPTPQACKLYNSLQRDGKSVLFVIHNTC